MKKLVVALVAAAVLAAVAGGGYFAYSSHQQKQVAAKAETDCHRILDPLSRKLAEINARVSVGMNSPEMHQLVSDAAVRYGNLDPKTMAAEDVACLYISVHFEKAYLSYVEADDEWSECIQTTGCDVERDKVEDMREKWNAAGDELNKGKDALAGYKYRGSA